MGARRRVLFAALACLLGACASEPPVGSASDIGRALREASPATPSFLGDDGERLPMRVFLPETAPRAAIVALHGFNDYANAFSTAGPALALRGFAVYAYDQRGFGETRQRGLWAGMAAMEDDLATAVRFARQRHPGLPVHCLGESMGGAVIVAAMTRPETDRRPLCDRLVVAAPAVWGRRTQPLIQRVALWIAANTLPSLRLTPRNVRIRPSDNIEMLIRLGRDPTVIKGARVEAVEGLVDLMDTALAAAPGLATPTLVLYGANDQLVPEEPTRLFVDRLPPGRHRVAYYANGYHMLLRDLGAALVLGDVAAWLRDPAAALPSGADQAAERWLGKGGI